MGLGVFEDFPTSVSTEKYKVCAWNQDVEIFQ